MKTVRILGFVVIVIIVFFASTDGFKGFKDGWNAVPDISSDINPVSLSVVPDKTLIPDSIYNTELQRNVSYKMSDIETYVSRSNNVYYKFLNFVAPFVFFFIYGCYCLVRLLIDICRNQVLTRKNVRRMRYQKECTPYAFLHLFFNVTSCIFGNGKIFRICTGYE